VEKEPLTFPELKGKQVSELSVYDDEMFGREVLVRFTDGTQLSIAIGVKQIIDARYCSEESPDIPIFVRLDPPPSKP
jgi:hypothetical protein